MNSGGEWRVSLCPELVLSPETSAAAIQFPPVHRTVCPAFCFPGGKGAICLFGRKNGKFLTRPVYRSDVE